MDVSFCIFGGLDLYDEVDAGDVKTARSDVGGNQDAELFLFEALESDLSLVLRNVSVHDFNVFLNFLRQKKVVGLLLG